MPPTPLFVLTDVQKAPLTISPVDAAGNAAPVEGVVWSSSDPTVLTVEAAPDGLSAVITAVGPLGDAQVSVTADAQIGDGVTELTGVLAVRVVASQAVAFNITAGTPEPK
jgi:hypothetical protein